MLILSVMSPLVVILVCYRQRYVLLWLYPLCGFVFDVGIMFLKRVLESNYGWPANLYMLLEFILVLSLFRKKVFKNNIFFYGLLSAGILFFSIQAIILAPLKFNMTGASAFHFIYMLCAIKGMYVILKEHQVAYIERSAFFWFNVAILIYAAGAFFIFLFRNFVVAADVKLYLALWKNIYLVINILKNLLIGVALYHLNKSNKREFD